MVSSDGLIETGQGMPLSEAAEWVEEITTALFERLENSRDRGDVDKRLERAARSVKAEHEQLRWHLNREDEEQVILSMERLLRKIVRFQRRL
jgi:hypothetical protein